MPPEPLAKLRAMGLTQVEMAALLCVGQSTISQWETGARQMPQFVQEDLWELLRLVEERMRAGIDVHQAVQGWQPTVLLNPGGPTRLGAPVGPIPRAVAEAAAREGPEAMERLVFAETVGALVKAAESPVTAEQWARVRRLALTIEMDADTALRFMGEEEG